MSYRAILIAVASSAAVTAVSVGCNGILGNEEGSLRVASEGGSERPLNGDGGVACDTSQGNKVCFGLCVKIDQPNTGCGESSCAACDPKNVVAISCKGGTTTLACGYDACKPGFDNCDGQLANGCEASLNAKNSCGSCTTTCGGATPFCAAAGGSFGCVASCPPGTENCGGSCVDTALSLENCGGCGTKCSRQAATAVCEGSTCKYTCNVGTHACGDRCASDLDPKACGPSCTECPVRPNTIATCTAAKCGTICAPEYNDCDNNPLNGCETHGPCSVPVGCLQVPCPALQQCCANQCISVQTICNELPPNPEF